MRNILKFKRKNGSFRYTNSAKGWQESDGTHYLHYPFMIHKYHNKYSLTHLSSGALVCRTSGLYSAKYIATRLFPLPQFLLPDTSLVKYMSEPQKKFCTDIIGRYRDVSKDKVIELDKNCPFSI